MPHELISAWSFAWGVVVGMLIGVAMAVLLDERNTPRRR
jgi:ABC-type nitrate/sulfonate/bicarbonate transport system permease component